MIRSALILIAGLGFAAITQADLRNMTLQFHNHSKHDVVHPLAGSFKKNKTVVSEDQLDETYVALPCGESKKFKAKADKSLMADTAIFSFLLYAYYLSKEKDEQYFLGSYKFEQDAPSEGYYWALTDPSSSSFIRDPFRVVVSVKGPGTFDDYKFDIHIYPLNHEHECK